MMSATNINTSRRRSVSRQDVFERASAAAYIAHSTAYAGIHMPQPISRPSSKLGVNYTTTTTTSTTSTTTTTSTLHMPKAVPMMSYKANYGYSSQGSINNPSSKTSFYSTSTTSETQPLPSPGLEPRTASVSEKTRANHTATGTKKRVRRAPGQHPYRSSTFRTTVTALLRIGLLHIPLGIFALGQLTIALIIAPLLLLMATCTACSAAFCTVALDAWNPRWWRLVKDTISALLARPPKPTRSTSAATSPSAAKSTSPTKTKSEPEEKPLYERLVEDERRRVREMTEKLRHQRSRSASLSHSSSNFGASMVAGLAQAVDMHYATVPVRRHRHVASSLRKSTLATDDVAPSFDDASEQDETVEMLQADRCEDDFDHAAANDAATAYHDAAAELAALFQKPIRSHIPSSGASPLATSTMIHAARTSAVAANCVRPLPQMHRANRVGMVYPA
jgi:hypothetical protein